MTYERSEKLLEALKELIGEKFETQRDFLNMLDGILLGYTTTDEQKDFYFVDDFESLILEIKDNEETAFSINFLENNEDFRHIVKSVTRTFSRG